MLHGEADHVELAIFDYQYTTGHGKSRRTPRQTVLYLQAADLNLPDFALRPEHLFDKIGSALGFHDINFDTHPEFSRRFSLKGTDDATLRLLFDEQVLSFFEGASGISVEGAGQQMIYYRPSVLAPPASLRPLLDEGFRIYTQLRDRCQHLAAQSTSPFTPDL
jgi:hypothetical protein